LESEVVGDLGGDALTHSGPGHRELYKQEPRLLFATDAGGRMR
jgi:hypothetical protein